MKTADSDRPPLSSFRTEFPVTKTHIYLDHAGIAPISLRVKKAVEGFLDECTRSGAFPYPFWMSRVNEVRKACARLINADRDEIAFVKSTSHGLSLVASGLDWKAGDNVLIFESEFPSNIYPWLHLKARGVEARVVPSRKGLFLFDDIKKLIDARTRLLTVSSVQFRNGFRIDLERLGALCRGRNVLFCVDAIQSLGVLPLDVKKCQVDFLSADGHKWLLAPEGIGLFFCRKELAERIDPPLLGWKSVENALDFDHVDLHLRTDALRFEEGSLNVMGIVGLGAALELLGEAGMERIEQQVLDLGELIISEAEQRGLELRSPRDRASRGGIVSFTGEFDPLKVRDGLRAQGIMVNVRGGALRVSPHFYNTKEDIQRFYAAFDGIL
ncbi:MAG: hypothetical protein A2X56_12615 [Nitrospirae bacterium GWC2_57_13]|jgi:cysteine desulfurase / selenocysteine lyase|nr:MAG: hypothetical protein A2072_08825 [Nitrospirae bacterium GWC1_57_7]OGW27743.1 MAG: hypothetical protein A2X56_12615 [Nitrospirae bacterium GWC2_57_13]OGW46703.1 MAG: hypothetical protein A2X57_00215 [Nitrospirae bacterium GWD2_57_8]HAS55609.1 aminotransferase [Nitrospiraceae bacterium]